MVLDTLIHFFVPRYSNEHKAKVLHNSSLTIMLLIVIVYQFILSAVPLTGSRVLGYAANISVSEVVDLTNQKRIEHGVNALTTNELLTEAARRKGEDMLAKDYWAHVSPDGTEPWAFFDNVGYVYRYAGENLARDFSNAQSAVDAWMASPSHRENLLSPKYQEIGVAVVEGDLNGVDTTLIVQLFGTRSLSSQVQVPESGEGNEVVAVSSVGVPSEITSTPVPTVSVAPVANKESTEIVQVESVEQMDNLISPFTLTRTFSIAILSLLLLVIAVDGIIVSRRKIPRLGGRSLAHFAFLGVILVIAVIAHAGDIL